MQDATGTGAMVAPRWRGSARGFSLVELLVAIAILGILAAIAVPAYQGYLATAREGVLNHNIATMRVFQEDYRIRTGAYSDEDWAPGDGPTETGWQPEQDGRNVSYTVTVDGNSYTVTATDADTGTSVTRTFP